MSLKKVSKEQPDKIEYSKENLILAEKIIQTNLEEYYLWVTQQQIHGR